MISEDSVRAKLHGNDLVHAVDTVRGSIRVETTLRYPDGHSIDVFVVPREDGMVMLTDFGQMGTMLREASLNVDRVTEDIVQRFAEITLPNDIHHLGVALMKFLKEGDDLSSHVNAFAHVLHGMAAILFTCSEVN